MIVRGNSRRALSRALWCAESLRRGPLTNPRHFFNRRLDRWFRVWRTSLYHDPGFESGFAGRMPRRGFYADEPSFYPNRIA